MIFFPASEEKYQSICLHLDEFYQRHFVNIYNAFALVLAPDVAKNFPDSDIVNETLRAIAKIAHLHGGGVKTGIASSPS